MSAGTKRPYGEALKDAEAFRDLFAGTYDSWTIAGSLRRKKSEVSDVEHVVVPHFSGDLFGGACVNLFWQRMDKLIEVGTLAKHLYGEAQTTRWGDIYRGCNFRGFTHEVFTATPQNVGAILLIRTGPDTYSKHVVTRLLMGGMYRQQDGVLVAAGGTVPVPDERTYLLLAGLPWTEPESRR